MFLEERENTYEQAEAITNNSEEKEIVIEDEERQLCEVWTRVMGYFRPVASFNKGKKSEFAERKYFEENKIDDSKTRS